MFTLVAMGFLSSKIIIFCRKPQIGSACNIHVSCSNTTSHDFTWSTGPMINRLPAFHLLFAAGILSTGLESSKVIRMFDALKIINIKKRGLSNILKSYVIPAVFHVWDREQKSNLASVRLIIFTLASKIIVCRLNFGIKANRHLNIRLELHP